MEKHQEHIRYLWNQFIEDKSTTAEVNELMAYIKNNPDDTYSNEYLATQMAKYQSSDSGDAEFWSKSLDRILPSQQSATSAADLKSAANTLSPGPSYDSITPPVHRVHFLKTTWFRYAAILLLVAGTAVIYYRGDRPKQVTVRSSVQLPTDIVPGGNKAVLILADGSSIVLDSVADGNLAAQGNTSIIKLQTGRLAYSAGKQLPGNGEVLYNTVRTPRGGQYQIVLSDGTKVWLNAASSVTFPTVFTKDRRVTISGEAYLEVARDKSKAFTLTANGTMIEVLGTGFNVNSYADEPATFITLVEGGIKVIKKDQSIVLHPGEQAVSKDTLSLNKDIRVNQVLAWKNGLFNFQNKKLDEVMRQLARWYDLEIVYPSSVPDITFVGGISRNMQLSDLLKTLKQSEVNYRMEGRKLIILP